MKDFNPLLFKEQVRALFPVDTSVAITLGGFDVVTRRILMTPSAQARPIVISSGVVTQEAQPGEIWMETEVPPTSQQLTDYDDVISNHVSTNKSAAEVAEAQDVVDLDDVEADYENYSTLSTARKDVLVEKTMRLLLRDQGRAT